MPTILGKKLMENDDAAILISALKETDPRQVDKVVSDGDIDSREAVDIFLFDCDKNGEITMADTLSKCVETNPLLGKVVSVLRRHGMELEEKNVPQLIANAKRSMAEGALDNAVSLYKQAFAVTSDKSIKRDILKDLGACEGLRLNDESTPHEDLPHILRQAERVEGLRMTCAVKLLTKFSF